MTDIKRAPDIVDVTWARVEDGFYVASRGGEFLGYIDRRDDGAYEAFDLLSRRIGKLPALAQAMTALVEKSYPLAQGRAGA